MDSRPVSAFVIAEVGNKEGRDRRLRLKRSSRFFIDCLYAFGGAASVRYVRHSVWSPISFWIAWRRIIIAQLSAFQVPFHASRDLA